MDEQRWDILGIGNSAVDELIYLEYFPLPDTKQPILDMRRQGGGLTATALVSAARQGARAAFCSLIGEDELSAFTLADLAAEGVDTSPCLRAPEGVPYHAYILVERSGDTRTILYQPGRVEPPLEHITPGLVSRCRVLFIDHHAPAAGIRAARLASELGIPVVADVEKLETPGLDEFLALSTHLIIGISFAHRLTGKSEAVEMVKALGGPERACCVVTAGREGCWYAERGGPVLHVPAFEVPVVDTTGCGDVFHGVYAAALARGEPAARAVLQATAAAGIKATRPGGRSGIPDRAAVERFLTEQDGRRSV